MRQIIRAYISFFRPAQGESLILLMPPCSPGDKALIPGYFRYLKSTVFFRRCFFMAHNSHHIKGFIGAGERKKSGDNRHLQGDAMGSLLSSRGAGSGKNFLPVCNRFFNHQEFLPRPDNGQRKSPFLDRHYLAILCSGRLNFSFFRSKHGAMY